MARDDWTGLIGFKRGWLMKGSGRTKVRRRKQKERKEFCEDPKCPWNQPDEFWPGPRLAHYHDGDAIVLPLEIR